MSVNPMKYADEHYLKQLADFLRVGDFVSFERLVDRLRDEGYTIDFSQISNIEQLVSNIYIAYLQNGVNIDGMLQTLKFANNMQILVNTTPKNSHTLSEQKLELIKLNIFSLFSDYTEGFLNYILYYLPDRLSQYISNANVMFIDNQVSLSDRVKYIHSIVDNVYSVGSYGLRTRKIGTFSKYLQRYQGHRAEVEDNYYSFEIKQSDLLSNQSQLLMASLWFELSSLTEQHLIYAPSLERVKEKYYHGDYHYEYPIVSMVTTGGLGPEGKGFVYLTPRGNIIEVCSDAKQTKAYVIEYKKYLKDIFLQKLEKKMRHWDISENLKLETLNFFNENIRTKIVDFHKIETINIDEILDFIPPAAKSHINPDFFTFLKSSLLDIFFPIQMEDQFKVRMDLISNQKLTETEIAKLASLGNVSHYDVLNQRFFFLNQIEILARILNIPI